MEPLHILIVDDEAGMRMGAARALRGYEIHVAEIDEDVGFEVDQAESGEEALKKVAVRQPDILLLDQKMGGMSGLEVLEKLQPELEDILVIMITAYASIETAVTAMRHGAYDFLPKPFTPAELKNTVRKAATRLILSRQTRKLAEEKRQVRFQFIRVLGHELKAPLNAVEGYLNIMTDRVCGNDIAAYEETLGRCAHRINLMRKLILELLDLTSIESGQKQRDLQKVDLAHVADLAIETVQAGARERQIAVNLHAPKPLPMTADPGEVEIILNNLVSNAVKYNRDGGRVDVTLEKEGEKITLTVADTGIGLKPEEAQKLFHDFVRIRNEKTARILGTGLGLSIAKKLAQLYDGDAVVESTPDVGSTFTVTLFDRPSEAANAAATSAAVDNETPA